MTTAKQPGLAPEQLGSTPVARPAVARPAVARPAVVHTVRARAQPGQAA